MGPTGDDGTGKVLFRHECTEHWAAEPRASHECTEHSAAGPHASPRSSSSVWAYPKLASLVDELRAAHRDTVGKYKSAPVEAPVYSRSLTKQERLKLGLLPSQACRPPFAHMLVSILHVVLYAETQGTFRADYFRGCFHKTLLAGWATSSAQSLPIGAGYRLAPFPSAELSGRKGTRARQASVFGFRNDPLRWQQDRSKAWCAENFRNAEVGNSSGAPQPVTWVTPPSVARWVLPSRFRPSSGLLAPRRTEAPPEPLLCGALQQSGGYSMGFVVRSRSEEMERGKF